jgi:hypothetical protein
MPDVVGPVLSRFAVRARTAAAPVLSAAAPATVVPSVQSADLSGVLAQQRQTLQMIADLNTATTDRVDKLLEALREMQASAAAHTERVRQTTTERTGQVLQTTTERTAELVAQLERLGVVDLAPVSPILDPHLYGSKPNNVNP